MAVLVNVMLDNGVIMHGKGRHYLSLICEAAYVGHSLGSRGPIALHAPVCKYSQAVIQYVGFVAVTTAISCVKP